MAFDGIMINSIVQELKGKMLGGRISKIQQTDENELFLTIKGDENLKLIITADASLPLIYITEESKTAPLTAPNFCMLLRKYIGNGRIIDIRQPSFERIVEIVIEHRNEMGDMEEKRLISEFMGRHSNIILVDKNDVILDSIKRVSHDISSVREVLPGRVYSYPPAGDRKDPRFLTREEFLRQNPGNNLNVKKALYTVVNGFSPMIAEEICFRAGVDPRADISVLSENEKDALWQSFSSIVSIIKEGKYSPKMFLDKGMPKEFSAFDISIYDNYDVRGFESPSKLIFDYYSEKASKNRISTKSSDMRHHLATLVERTAKKLDLQMEQLKDTEDREKYRVYGELINTYGYSAGKGAKELKCINYYDNNEIVIPLDENLTPSENSVKYFAKYNKKKRTYEALTALTEETSAELDYLLSVQNALSMATSEDELFDLRTELSTSGFMKMDKSIKKAGKKNSGKKGVLQKSKPMHFVSSDGYDIYVGRNNMQNDELSFKFASGNDMWFHAKKMPGSHVIVKKKDENAIPDSTYEEAARLAAFYSSGKDAPKVEIDYTEKKNLKKPPKANLGYVIYHTNYSMMASPDISGIRNVDQGGKQI
ncbi:Predicted component of the ribosome quality control (RQC) complex, YloA/Tae2 family, contains fibronectin-binding (FbpA) and DUF814 domains [Eubacterium ruminantium]|nr:Predicted component of the ribosome quality control (RQC) complex, YloA/Tae2 family, contains fibronectin-binding (FbpA) and DUF814 domains [Eubacterium ruminantium]